MLYLERYPEAFEDPFVEQVVADDAPFEVWVRDDRTGARDGQHEHDRRRHPSPRMPDGEGPDLIGPSLVIGDLGRGHPHSAQLIAPLTFGVLIAPDWTPHVSRICLYLPFAISTFSANRTGWVMPVVFGIASP